MQDDSISGNIAISDTYFIPPLWNVPLRFHRQVPAARLLVLDEQLRTHHNTCGNLDEFSDREKSAV